MVEEDPLCPECGYELTGIRVLKDDETGEITIEFFCDEAGDDIFRFQIITGLTDEDIGKLTEIGKTIQKEMRIKLIERKSEEEALRDL
jgi:hypothetical protein